MPARTNDFQKLIYLLKHNLAQDAVVTESKMLDDLVAGDQVEVDVCVEASVAGDNVKICVECRDRSRKADKNWVHEMKAKHERLPTNLLLLASNKGFTKKALELARSYGIQTVTLEQVESQAFPQIFAHEMSLWAKSFSIAVECVWCVVDASDTFPEERVRMSPEHEIFDADSVYQLKVADLVGPLINSPMVRTSMFGDGRPEHRWFEFEWRPVNAPPMYLQKIEPRMLRRVNKIIVAGPCSFTLSGVPLRRGKIGSTQLAWGKTVIFGRNAIPVATRDELGVEKVRINLSNAPSPREPEGNTDAYRH
jgi:hypothetical protein